jgi:hypothetical protein
MVAGIVRYQAWGDFHFGIVGTAADFPPTYLFQAAGWVDRHHAKYVDGKPNPNSYLNNPSWGAPPWGMNWVTGTFYGGTGPNYGDDEYGHELVIDGINYFNNWWKVSNKVLYLQDERYYWNVQDALDGGYNLNE